MVVRGVARLPHHFLDDPLPLNDQILLLSDHSKVIASRFVEPPLDEGLHLLVVDVVDKIQDLLRDQLANPLLFIELAGGFGVFITLFRGWFHLDVKIYDGESHYAQP